MIFYKSLEDIEKLKESSLLVGKTLGEIAKLIKPGVSTGILDKRAQEFIFDNNAVPSFLNYHGFPNTLCISINDVVVHGIPGKAVLREGDIVSVDCGVFKNGFHGDSAFTFEIGEISPEKKKLLMITKEALYLGIDAAIEGRRLGDIGNAIQSHAEKNGYSVVRELVGHGIGRNLHESPEVPNYGKKGAGIKLLEGLVIAIEPMINMGKKAVMQANDGWTVSTRDGKPSAHFEHTIVVRKNKAEILTTFEFIEK